MEDIWQIWTGFDDGFCQVPFKDNLHLGLTCDTDTVFFYLFNTGAKVLTSGDLRHPKFSYRLVVSAMFFFFTKHPLKKLKTN